MDKTNKIFCFAVALQEKLQKYLCFPKYWQKTQGHSFTVDCAVAEVLELCCCCKWEQKLLMWQQSLLMCTK